MKKTETNFYSEKLGKTYTYYLLYPDTQVDEAYVLYVQDGKDYLELGSLEHAYQQMLDTYPNEANKLLLVAIHPGDSMDRWHAYHHGGRNFHSYLSLMTEEFIPAIEKYLVEAGHRITKRGFLGDSLAANSSLNIAMDDPETWTHLLLQSAAITKEDIMECERKEAISFKVYQTVGVYEDEYVSVMTNERLYLLKRNRQLKNVLQDKGAVVTYLEQETEHEWQVWKRQLPDALRFFLKE